MSNGHDPLSDPLPAPVGFESSSDPDALVPEPTQHEEVPIAPAQAPAAPRPVVDPLRPPLPPVVHPAPARPAPAVPYAPPTTPPAPAPVVPPPPPAAPSPVAPSSYAVATPDDVEDLLAAPDVAPQHEAHLAPLHRSSRAVDTADPRGALGAMVDRDAHAVDPTVPLADVAADRPEIERLLTGLVVNNGSDMHIAHGQAPRWRVAGALLPVAGERALSTEDIERMLRPIIPDNQWDEFKATGDLDCAYAMSQDDGAALTVRFRCNVFRSMDQTGAVFRVIPTKIVSLDDLGVLPQIKRLAEAPRGLILFCGPTGSGKSTSQAGLIDLINETRTERIFTLEDPVEFTHSSKRCLVNHREIGPDTASFLEGLRRVRREDPDIIQIGEMRDYETIGAAIEAADTGHLVLATLHTNSAPDTISRIINSFPAERQEQIRITLAETLLAVICQTLVPSPTSPRGRVVAQEVMFNTPGVANNIRENDIPAIKNSLTDTSSGSISLDAHLVELIRSGQITKKEALKKASSSASLERYLGNTDRAAMSQ